MKIYQENLSELFKAFVKNADVRNDVLKWIGDCFSENQGKEYYLYISQLKIDFYLGINQEWSSHDLSTAYLFVSDGFLLNFNIILLNLARPFAEPYSTKLLKINPIYAISQNENVHLKGK
jgi:hypothetical protein